MNITIPEDVLMWGLGGLAVLAYLLIGSTVAGLIWRWSGRTINLDDVYESANAILLAMLWPIAIPVVIVLGITYMLSKGKK